MKEAVQQTFFYELFVMMCPVYLTDNINIITDLANDTSVREHSLAFNSVEEIIFLEDMIETKPIGGTIDLPTPPTSINFELYPNCYGYHKETFKEYVEKSKA